MRWPSGSPGSRRSSPTTWCTQNVRVRDGQLEIGDERLALDAIGRIVVVGAGKAGAGMAAGLEQALGPRVCRKNS